ncbi:MULTISPECIES: response regulator [Clostridium]|uniref:Stage 0 sporulation protein A homolog n=2 Tax=Clostridium TaxID=1485 RepID=A0A0E3M6R9_CLOSL|nr:MULTISPECIES: response regulator [Clostridium]AKA69540.1 response regulator receiver protein [Clostridium scatologenes]AWI04370.1 response regulator [Clostridium drakei]
MGVLIVDDSMFMRHLITKILNKHEINILGEAANGREAIDKYKELKPDVVTLDLMMNEMTGLEALEEIMKIDPEAQVIICSSMGQKAFIKEAIELGARGFVIKPFDEDALVDEVQKALMSKKDK